MIGPAALQCQHYGRDAAGYGHPRQGPAELAPGPAPAECAQASPTWSRPLPCRYSMPRWRAGQQHTERLCPSAGSGLCRLKSGERLDSGLPWEVGGLFGSCFPWDPAYRRQVPRAGVGMKSAQQPLSVRVIRVIRVVQVIQVVRIWQPRAGWRELSVQSKTNRPGNVK